MTFWTNTTLKQIIWPRAQDTSLDQEVPHQAELTSDKSNKSSGTESAKSDLLEDVAEFEIQWEEIAIGERIGLGKVDLLFNYL